MDDSPLQGLLISDFNAEVLANYLNNAEGLPALEVASADFNQVMAVLLNPDDPSARGKDFLFIWTQPDRLFDSFRRFLAFEDVSLEEILEEVDRFSQLLRSREKGKTVILIAGWMLAPYQHKVNVLQDMKKRRGLSYVLMKMNARLIENTADSSSIHVLNPRGWVEAVGRNAFNPKLWYMGKIPFDSLVFKEAAGDIKAALRGIRGLSRKLVVLDLDDTLWGGIVGDEGWENIRLGGHDPIGEAFADFQLALRSLKRQGILLGIVSKNEEATALEAIRRHPEMVLKEEDFSGWRINWNDKAQNIAELAAELNLGLQSVIFIDDNPIERARVRETLPEVLVPDWPQDKLLYRKTLLSLGCFDSPNVTAEDLERSRMYAQERGRKDMLTQVGSLDEWLKSLDIKVKVTPLSKMDLARTTQLLNKTNQMNLSTRRMSEPELEAWAAHPSRKLWTFRVADKFGDSGLTGIASVEIDGPVALIVDFILSCRVFGRKVEDLMLHVVYAYARERGVTQLQARYLPTAKNKPCLEFLQRLKVNEPEPQLFVWDMTQGYEVPEQLTVDISEGATDVIA
ncbi:MAG: HAD-IIIC family phosphatase [Candidatus Omnitrophota bacterium]|nr:HAD-IIIC family phosphatase [Candidatus Omnitrophota bacterium]